MLFSFFDISSRGISMIRIRKPVKLLEWGEGTNTTNQVWTEIAEGHIVRNTRKSGVTTLVVKLSSGFQKKNNKDNHVKVVQEGEGMAANSKRWGEVAMGVVKAFHEQDKTVEVEVTSATKIDQRRNVPAWEEGNA